MAAQAAGLCSLPTEILENHLFCFLSLPSLIACCFLCSRLKKLTSSYIAKLIRRLERGPFLPSTRWKRIASYSDKRQDVVLKALFQNGNMDLLLWFQSFLSFPTFSSKQLALISLPQAKAAHVKRFEECLYVAAREGHLHLLQHYSQANELVAWKRIFFATARAGHMEQLQWLYLHGHFDWSTETCAWAARGGQLEVLKWLHKHGCPWDWETCAAAAYAGHLQVLKWAREQGCDWNIWTYNYALVGEQLEVLEWIKRNGCDCTDFGHICGTAIQGASWFW